MELVEKIKGILFYKNEPVRFEELAKILGAGKSDIQTALDDYRSREGAPEGIVIIENENEVSLGTHADLADIVATLVREEETKPLTKVSLETLSIILYSGGITKPELDEIRGVNCAFILRNLMVRGLVEREDGGGRSPRYIPTLDLLGHLGIERREDLDQFEDIQGKFREMVSSIEQGGEEDEQI